MCRLWRFFLGRINKFFFFLRYLIEPSTTTTGGNSFITLMNFSYYGSWIDFDVMIPKRDPLFFSVLKQSQRMCAMCFFENQSILNPHQCEGICDECLFRYLRVVINGELLKRNQQQSMQMGCYCGYCDLTISENTILRILEKDRKLSRKYERYKANLLVKYNESYCWCPRPGCETLLMKPSQSSASTSSISPATTSSSPQKLIICSTCQLHFCSQCRNEYLSSDHESFPCHQVILCLPSVLPIHVHLHSSFRK
jgi:hypothetical protein